MQFHSVFDPKPQSETTGITTVVIINFLLAWSFCSRISAHLQQKGLLEDKKLQYNVATERE